MIKKLISTTIIPENLYIERNADKQLRNTVYNMGRPASILVSRQMGKTNLLLNLKRNMQDDDMLFIYIDLSSAMFNDIRDCFRFIIDTVIDTNLNIFEDIVNEILTTRNKNRLPNREHEQELLILLQYFRGKIVIILDEIDSMKKYNFSDQFFSQIRSVYFASRSNYVEFNNLTYILSGVLEPAEIIHDKTKSPFNISEKIYLNDFTKEEYNLFIEKLNFKFFDDIEILNSVYNWTNGHPRITWDICSKLEDLYNEKKNITLKDIDDIVNQLYINHSDTPPIDNIKILISEDISLAQSILDIKQKIFLNISDAIKNKLYLFGIIEINESENIRIKNKILEENLTEEFLKNIIYSQKSSFELAEQYFYNGKYKEAIVEYERVLNSDNTAKQERNIALINGGLCLYYLDDFVNALNHMNKVSINKDVDPYNYYINETNKGLCLRSLGKYKDSLEKYKLVLDYDQPIFKIRTYLNMANLYYTDNFEENQDKMLECINNGLELISKFKPEDKNEIRQINDFLVNLYYSKATYHLEKTEKTIARTFFEKILSLEVDEYKPTILIDLINLEDNEQVKKVFMENIFDIIQNNKITVNNFQYLKYGLTTIYEYIFILIQHNEDKLLKDFLNFCQNTYTEYFSSKCSVLLQTGKYFFNSLMQYDNAFLVFNKAISFRNGEMVFSECYKDILFHIVYNYFRKDTVTQELVTEYFTYLNLIIENSLFNKLNFDDYTILSQTIRKFIKNNKIEEANKAISLIDKLLENFNVEHELVKSTFLDLKHYLADEKDKINLSNACIENINKYKSNLKKYPVQFEQFIKVMIKHHTKYIDLNNFRDKLVLKVDPKIPRNQSCPCGSGKKYKQCCIKK